MKECNDCKETKELSEFYSQLKSTKNLGVYLYYHPYCKACTVIRSQKYQRNNKKKTLEYGRKDYKKKESYYKNKAKGWTEENAHRKKETFKIWQFHNKDKIKEYQEKRRFHKNHDISDEELYLIYEYSSSSCMYCGLTEDESIAKYGQKLHKDHAINEGSDGIDNCVLACKGCNSSKHDKDWDEWFSQSEHYSEIKYEAIKEWLSLWE